MYNLSTDSVHYMCKLNLVMSVRIGLKISSQLHKFESDLNL